MKKRKIITNTIVASIFVLFNSNAYAQINNGNNSGIIGSTSSSTGINNTGGGLYSFSNGSFNTASGTYSTALGVRNISSGPYSIAGGGYSQATGVYSIALGRNAIAGGVYSRSIGFYSEALGNYSFAIGNSVKSTATQAFVIGNGVNPSNSLSNNITNSLMVGFYSDIPTLFVGPSAGVGTSGNVGIGTTKITDEFKLSVAGKIRAEEVEISLSGPWADYVFASEYQLKSLEEVEKYIQENNHLPNIPSAKEVETDGLSLGEMQVKMMEKIEELTLYLIKQDKEINQLKEENKELRVVLELK